MRHALQFSIEAAMKSGILGQHNLQKKAAKGLIIIHCQH